MNETTQQKYSETYPAWMAKNDEAERVYGQLAEQTLPIANIIPWDKQPRKFFDPEAMEQLTATVREHGVQSAIAVRPRPEMIAGALDVGAAAFVIIAGERRFRAAIAAGLKYVKVNIYPEMSDFAALKLAHCENHIREDPTALEDARGYQMMLDESPGLTQTELAKQLNIPQSTISNSLRLLRLPWEWQDRLEHKVINQEFAKSLCAFLGDTAQLEDIGQRALAESWSTAKLDAEIKLIKQERARREEELASQPTLPLDVPTNEPVSLTPSSVDGASIDGTDAADDVDDSADDDSGDEGADRDRLFAPTEEEDAEPVAVVETTTIAPTTRPEPSRSCFSCGTAEATGPDSLCDFCRPPANVPYTGPVATPRVTTTPASSTTTATPTIAPASAGMPFTLSPRHVEILRALNDKKNQLMPQHACTLLERIDVIIETSASMSGIDVESFE